eukprot:scaffold107298_cov58-Attheya_sp.AAC.1
MRSEWMYIEGNQDVEYNIFPTSADDFMGIRGHLLIQYPEKVFPPMTTETSDPVILNIWSFTGSPRVHGTFKVRKLDIHHQQQQYQQSEWTYITLKKVPVKISRQPTNLQSTMLSMRIGRYGMS